MNEKVNGYYGRIYIRTSPERGFFGEAEDTTENDRFKNAIQLLDKLLENTSTYDYQKKDEKFDYLAALTKRKDALIDVRESKEYAEIAAKIGAQPPQFVLDVEMLIYVLATDNIEKISLDILNQLAEWHDDDHISYNIAVLKYLRAWQEEKNPEKKAHLQTKLGWALDKRNHSKTWDHGFYLNLPNVTLDGIDLSETEGLYCIILDNASLERATLPKELSHISMQLSNFKHARFPASDRNRVELTYVDADCANFSDTLCDMLEWKWFTCKSAVFERAELTFGDCWEVDASDASFDAAKLSRFDFDYDVHIDNASFVRTKFIALKHPLLPNECLYKTKLLPESAYENGDALRAALVDIKKDWADAFAQTPECFHRDLTEFLRQTLAHIILSHHPDNELVYAALTHPVFQSGGLIKQACNKVRLLTANSIFGGIVDSALGYQEDSEAVKMLEAALVKSQTLVSAV